MITKAKIIAALQQYMPDQAAHNFDKVADAILQPPVISEAKWLNFIRTGQSESGKTSIYQVRAKEQGVLLGEIRWYGAFRCYCFYPQPNTIFETQCLDDITNFINALMLLKNEKK